MEQGGIQSSRVAIEDVEGWKGAVLSFTNENQTVITLLSIIRNERAELYMYIHLLSLMLYTILKGGGGQAPKELKTCLNATAYYLNYALSGQICLSPNVYAEIH